MKLGAYNQKTNHLLALRDLTEDEISLHKEHTKTFSEAENRLCLFRILDKNFKELRNHIDDLLSSKYREPIDETDELNRLILNYLTFAYTIQEHFRVSYQRRFKKDNGRIKKYTDFIDSLCEHSPSFAFVLDYRGYVQHVGLAITNYTRTVSMTSVTVEILADPAELLKGSREWKRSKIKDTDSPIDLMETLNDFHIQMLQNFASFVVETFYPELKPAATFYGELTREAKKKDPETRMIFYEKEPEVVTVGGGKTKINAQISYPPNALFAELGITINP